MNEIIKGIGGLPLGMIGGIVLGAVLKVNEATIPILMLGGAIVGFAVTSGALPGIISALAEAGGEFGI